MGQLEKTDQSIGKSLKKVFPNAEAKGNLISREELREAIRTSLEDTVAEFEVDQVLTDLQGQKDGFVDPNVMKSRLDSLEHDLKAQPEKELEKENKKSSKKQDSEAGC